MRAGKDFSGAGQTDFDLVEVDLGSGTLQVLNGFHVKANDQNGWIPISVSFARRHSQKEFPWLDQAIKRDDFI